LAIEIAYFGFWFATRLDLPLSSRLAFWLNLPDGSIDP